MTIGGEADSYIPNANDHAEFLQKGYEDVKAAITLAQECMKIDYDCKHHPVEELKDFVEGSATEYGGGGKHSGSSGDPPSDGDDGDGNGEDNGEEEDKDEDMSMSGAGDRLVKWHNHHQGGSGPGDDVMDIDMSHF
ncbi:hypothetical protein FRC11_009884 [Ceratobasidium sp. 423]|nr:hypothetical protein FRC11_009884 [Ceratobasidium sp. 423]